MPSLDWDLHLKTSSSLRGLLVSAAHGGWEGGALSPFLSLSSLSLLSVPLLTCISSSTGGYTASCAAMSYPDIGAVVSYCNNLYVHVHVGYPETYM